MRIIPPETRVGRRVDCSSRCAADKRQCEGCEKFFGPPENLQPLTTDAEYALRFDQGVGQPNGARRLMWLIDDAKNAALVALRAVGR